ncbi:MAG: hypothetical protein IKN36_03465, partial [Clostridia bacterium]|nr:hypothetical protein [Clostridia bacterium]
AKAYVMVDENAGYFPNVIVPAGATVGQNGYLELKCDATSADGSYLSYVWYETPSGELMDMTAVNRGEETDPVLICDTSELGTRYYICMVETASYGRTYSSAIPVEVVEGEPIVTENTGTETANAADTGDTDAPESKEEDVGTGKSDDVSAPPEVGVTTTGAAGSSLPLWAVIALAACAAVIASLVTILIYKSKKK